MPESTPYLSITIPAHNEEKRLADSLEKVASFLQAQSYTSEVIVVENGSSDRTFEIAQSYLGKIKRLRVMHEEASGKGLAVRSGMLAAKGEYRFICDADLSMPINEMNRFLPPELTDFDVAIASREAKGAVRYGEPGYRHFIGRFFNGLVRWLALPGLNDTQCGFKCFKAEAAEKVFPLQRMNGWAFDVEVLYIARLKGIKIVEVPIPWYYNSGSRVRLFQDSLKMALDLLTILRNARKGLYK
jgi:glycosyltransferase involved in cell wall biosynthesis